MTQLLKFNFQLETPRRLVIDHYHDRWWNAPSTARHIPLPSATRLVPCNPRVTTVTESKS